MGLLFLLALAVPRAILALMWIYSDHVDAAFDSLLWPILGMAFLPWATIMYAVVWEPLSEVTQSEWLIVAGAAAVDVITWGSRLTQASRPYA